MRATSIFGFLVLALTAVGVFACGVEPYSGAALAFWPDTYQDAGPLPVPEASVAAVDAGPGSCRQAHARSLPQRLTTMSALANHTGTTLSGDDLFAYFDNSLCGQACHGSASAPPGLGNWRIASAAELTKIDETVLTKHVMSEGPTNLSNPNDPTDPNDPMPPYGNALYRPYSARLANDPVVAFVELFQAWIDAGDPMQSFTPPPGLISTSEGDHYVNTPNVGTDMTNIGNCVPDAVLIAQSRSLSNPNMAAMTALDNTFANGDITPDSDAGAAAQIGLPDDIFNTDLTTFDSSELAAQGVIAYQPTYPNWFDDAQAIRYIRVPIGQTIQFDKANQTFAIPDNTRFYETILKRIADVDGSYRWRKMETRILVVRNSSTPLVGTYLWNDAESDATLWAGPLAARNDGQPFKASTLFYNTDEQLAQLVAATTPANQLDNALIAQGAARHYAVPSRDQCGACHMGSPTGNFVLGFTPLQLNRRVGGAGGVSATPGADEMTQVQRFIDYGLLTGLSSATEIVPLEKAEGSRSPRNAYELAAQAYMAGNCAHCHNPNGAATKNNPELNGVLDFMPSTAGGGVFQFPLEKFSPRIPRGPLADIPVPYITPSLLDLSETTKASDLATSEYAPWRSLIFRAVDTPFPYTDDNALFPHMPMNGAGFDRSAKQIMSDWMVSIPAVRKNPGLSEYIDSSLTVNGVPVVDDTPQPYVEIPPGAPGYDAAVQSAEQRLGILHTGVNPIAPGKSRLVSAFSEYLYCPDTSDILDPYVEQDLTCHSVPTDVPPVGGIINYPIPDHAHWIPVDTTVASTSWSPVRNDWTSRIIGCCDQFNDSSLSLACGMANYTAAKNAQDEEKVAVSALQDASLAQVRDFATTPFPVGLWNNPSGCDMSHQETVTQFVGGGGYSAHWFTNPAANVSPDSSYVYAENPGAYVYTEICGNCHGANADGHGRLATNLALMTGGHGIPSNFIAGLFGPAGNGAGINELLAFATLPLTDAGTSPWASTTVDDRAARYTAWMGLGGTALVIPNSVVQIVSTTSVFGLQRALDPTLISGNMLSVAKALCTSLLFGSTPPGAPGGADTDVDVEKVWFTPERKSGNTLAADSELFASVGDAELWLRLCTLGNPPPVRAVYPGRGQFVTSIGVSTDSKNRLFSTDLFDPAFYLAPDGSPWDVGNDTGAIDHGISAGNLQPWCYRRGTVGDSDASETPVCPPTIDDGRTAPNSSSDLLVGENAPDAGASPLPGCRGSTTNPTDYHCWGPDEADSWATRGAINAGLVVFLYLQEVAKGTVTPLPPYNKCALLSSQP
jgi:mono/diheme cytochrome c family protein